MNKKMTLKELQANTTNQNLTLSPEKLKVS